MLLPLLAYIPLLKMETIYSSETSVDFYRTARCYISEDRRLHNKRCENFNPDYTISESKFWYYGFRLGYGNHEHNTIV
jgi:Pyruvate/2-oxoacid:ferredoxin oxidoreductase delta subunit